MNPPFLYFFIAATAAVVILTERLESVVLNKFFRGFVDEIRRVEAELNEYHALSILAIAMNDREAYEGLQRMANEKYWPLFFQEDDVLDLHFLFALDTLHAYHNLLHKSSSSLIHNVHRHCLLQQARLGIIIDSYSSWKRAEEVRKNFVYSSGVRLNKHVTI